MNNIQETIIVIGVVVVLLMGIVPPWKLVVDSRTVHQEFLLSHRIIFSPPSRPVESTSVYQFSCISLDVTRLAVQWITVFLVVLGLSLAFKKRPGTQVENRSGAQTATPG